MRRFRLGGAILTAMASGRSREAAGAGLAGLGLAVVATLAAAPGPTRPPCKVSAVRAPGPSARSERRVTVTDPNGRLSRFSC